MPVTSAHLNEFKIEVRRLLGEGEPPLYPAFHRLISSAYPREYHVDLVRRAPTGGFPDITVSRGIRLVNWIEVKSPLVDISPLPNPDAQRFQRYKDNLPHIVLTNGWHWLVYRRAWHVPVAEWVLPKEWLCGVRELTPVEEEGLLGFLDNITALAAAEATSYAEAVQLLAAAARLINRGILDSAEGGALPAQLQQAREAFGGLYRTNPDDPEEITLEQFADTLAQTCTFGYLIARVEADQDVDPQSAYDALDTDAHPFLKVALHAVTAPDAELELALKGVLRTACDAINAAAPILAGPGRDWSRVTYVYEPFFAEYRPEDRNKYGVYYTPSEVTEYQVEEIRRVLIQEYGLSGLSDPAVRYLDPACGTGTYLIALAERIATELEEQGLPVPAGLDEVFSRRVFGFDVFPGPAAVSQARLTAWLRGHGVRLRRRLSIFTVNTLTPPAQHAHHLAGNLWAQNISAEQDEGDRIKRDAPVLVILGNPPWGRRRRESFRNGPEFADNWVTEWAAGAEGAVISLYDLYVAFWRFGLRVLLERPDVQQPRGIISYITNRTWLRGKAFSQMRRWLRERAAYARIIDLGGDIRAGAGAEDEPVFAIETGCAITTLAFGGQSSVRGSSIMYSRVRGDREAKLNTLRQDAVPAGADVASPRLNAPFAPVDWGALEDAPSINQYFSIRYPGVKTHRDDLVVAADQHELLQKLAVWNACPAQERERLFDPSNDTPLPAPGYAVNPHYVMTHRYRPLDNRVLYFDRSFITRPGTISTVYQHNPGVFSLLTMDSRTREGPVVIGTNSLPGYNSFRGSYETHAFPLHARAAGELEFEEHTTLRPGARAWLQRFGAGVDELAAYILALGNAPRYAEVFVEALETEIVRIPATLDADLFAEAVHIGADLVRAWSLMLPAQGRWVQNRAGVPIGTFALEDDTLVFASGDRLLGVHPGLLSLEISTYPVLQRYLEARAHLPLSISLAADVQRVCASIALIIDSQPACDDVLRHIVGNAMHNW